MDNFIFCQNDKNRGAEYNTFALERESRYGFVCFVPSFDYVAHVAFDTAEDYMELVGCTDEGEPGYHDYNVLTLLEVGSQTCIGDAIWLRLW